MISVKFYLDVSRWPAYQMSTNIAENFNRLSIKGSRTLQADDRRQTDGRPMTYRVAENKIPHQTICNISATSGPILKKISKLLNLDISLNLMVYNVSTAH